jgi:hypothetical protein
MASFPISIYKDTPILSSYFVDILKCYEFVSGSNEMYQHLIDTKSCDEKKSVVIIAKSEEVTTVKRVNKRQCLYCDKSYTRHQCLYNHVRSKHANQVRKTWLTCLSCLQTYPDEKYLLIIQIVVPS